MRDWFRRTSQVVTVELGCQFSTSGTTGDATLYGHAWREWHPFWAAQARELLGDKARIFECDEHVEYDEHVATRTARSA